MCGRYIKYICVLVKQVYMHSRAQMRINMFGSVCKHYIYIFLFGMSISHALNTRYICNSLFTNFDAGFKAIKRIFKVTVVRFYVIFVIH